jgi:hypothetical protein
MRKIVVPLALLAATFICLLPAIPAQAQNTRSFVSGLGNDLNNCSLAAPCRTFQHAHDQTNAGGEIAVLNTAGYGAVNITKSISIVNPGGVEAGITVPSGGTAITINAPGAIVALRGLTLEGASTGQTGILFSSGASLNVRDSVIRNFSLRGINFASNSSTLSQLFVSNTLVSDNGSDGIYIAPTGSGTTVGVLDHDEMEKNGANGLLVYLTSSTPTITVTVSNSVSANNGNDGIAAEAPFGGALNVMVRSTTIANNTSGGLFTSGSGNQMRVTRSTITGNAFGWSALNTGTLMSYADNNFDGNTNVDTAPPSIVYK